MTAPEANRCRVLVVEDDAFVAELVLDCLSDAGFDADHVSRAEQARQRVTTSPPDIVILDLGLPDGDGIALTSQLKALAPSLGLIILSGRIAPVERIVGLEVGADDYLCKPFDPRELVARVRSLFRRLTPATPATSAIPPKEETTLNAFFFEGFTLDLDRVSLLTPNGEQPHLSSTEFALLRAFVERPNRVLTRDQLMDLIHSNDAPAFDRSIDVQIARLRKKIEPDCKEPRLIKTIRNQGYIFASRVTRSCSDAR